MLGAGSLEPRWWAPLFAALLALLSPVSSHADAPAPAGDAAERASELKRLGDAAMVQMQYLDALGHYEAAWALNEDPALLYNRGRAHQLLGDFPKALEMFEDFAARASPELRARAVTFDQLLDDVKKRVSTLRVRCNVKGARVIVREKRVGSTPLERAIRLNAGSATLEVEAEGYFPWRRRVELPGGASKELTVSLHSRRETGVLVVGSPVAGARVSVDGKAAGTVPVDVVLTPGLHRVVVRRDGYEDAVTSAMVDRGASRTLTVPLEKTRAITSRWWFWAGAGAVVLGGTALTIALMTEEPAPEGNIDPGQISAPLLRW